MDWNISGEIERVTTWELRTLLPPGSLSRVMVSRYGDIFGDDIRIYHYVLSGTIRLHFRMDRDTAIIHDTAIAYHENIAEDIDAMNEIYEIIFRARNKSLMEVDF
jgi:hypothetical protein